MGLGFGPSGLAPQPDPPAPAHAVAYRHALEPLTLFSHPVCRRRISLLPSMIVGPSNGSRPGFWSLLLPESGLSRVRRRR